MDGTIIIPKSGKKFGENEFDWKFWDKKVPDVLQKHHKEGSFNDIIQFIILSFSSVFIYFSIILPNHKFILFYV